MADQEVAGMVLEPPDLREAVIRRLKGVLA